MGKIQKLDAVNRKENEDTMDLAKLHVYHALENSRILKGNTATLFSFKEEPAEIDISTVLGELVFEFSVETEGDAAAKLALCIPKDDIWKLQDAVNGLLLQSKRQEITHTSRG